MLPTKSDQAVAATKSPTFLHLVQFSSSTASYRIVRLTIELFLVQYTTELGNSAAVAGYVYLAYSLAEVFAALFSLWNPLLWSGSIVRGSFFVVFTGAAMTMGLMGLFYSTRSILMAILSAIVCGLGTAAYFVHYQVLANTAFPSSSITKLAQTRQIFECLGFLLPSITLAIVMQDGSDFLQIIKTSVAVLVATSIVFLLINSVQLIKYSAKSGRGSDVSTQSVWGATKYFFTSSILKYFVLDTLILATSGVLFAVLSVSTEIYFGLDSAFLWLAVIAIPIGGAFAAFCGIKGWFTHNDDRRVALNGTMATVAMFLIMIIAGPLSARSLSVSIKKVILFLFGLVFGFLGSKTYTSALALKLLKLHAEPQDFITRANVLDQVGGQLVIAAMFQVQMVLLDAMAEKEFHPTMKGLFLFGLIVLMNVTSHMVARRIPFPLDSKFSWPVPTPFTYTKKMCLKTVSTFTGLSVFDLAFTFFRDFKISLFARRLSDDALACIEGGPDIPPDANLTPESLELHLKRFDDIGSQEEWWKSSASLDCFLMSNSACFSKRLELIDIATSSISIVTCSLTGSSGRMIVDKLIKRKSEGLDVRVIVDAANLYLFYEVYQTKSTEAGASNSLELLSMLKEAGVQIGMLDSWHEIDTNQPYLIGNHRKLMLIDDKWLLTGGRNLEDGYATPEGDRNRFKFFDSDVVLKGNFAYTTASLFQELWVRSKPVKTDFLTRTTNTYVHPAWLTLAEDMHDVDESNSIFETTPSAAFSVCDSVETDGTTDLDGSIKGRKSIYRVRSSLFSRSSSFALAMESSSIDTSAGVALFQLDHKGGRTDGKDIILSTVLFLITTARTRIDIIFGYLQLYPVLEDALKKAIARGVEVRVFTNSEETFGVFAYKKAFQKTFCALMDMGVKVYTPCESAENKTIHTKMLLVDSRALLIGSWSAWAYSVFYEEEFSVLLLDDEESSMFKPIETFYDKLITEGYLSQMTNAPPAPEISPVLKFFMSKYGRRLYEEGF